MKVVLFEVVWDGSQTSLKTAAELAKFESRVVLDGSQTHGEKPVELCQFESRVVLDGSQTPNLHKLYRL